MIVGALAGDAAIVLGLASRVVGHVSLFYGYDPESPAEKLFVMSTLNWSVLERIVDTADMAYRRRFLIEKYPHLGNEEPPGSFLDADEDGADSADRPISVLAELAEAGGPDLP